MVFVSRERLSERVSALRRLYLFKEAGWAFLGLAAQMLGQAATLKLITSMLSRTDYGLVALANSGSMFFQMIFLASVLQGMCRLASAAMAEGTVHTLIAATATAVAYVLVPLAATAALVAIWLGLSGQLDMCFLVLGATALTYADYRTNRTQFLALAARRRHLLAYHRGSDAVARAALVTGFLLASPRAALVPISFAMASLLVNAFFEPKLLRSVAPRTAGARTDGGALEQRRRLIAFAVPLGVASAMTWGQTSADRWLLTRYVTVENVGTYAAAVQVGALPFAILASFLSLFAQPILYKRADAGRKDVPAWIMIEGAVYALLAGAGLLVMTTQTEALVRFFLGRPQWSCAPLVPLVAAGSAVFRWSEVFLVGILVSGRTGLLIIPNLLGGAGAVAANLLLLPRMGVPGAAWALVVSSGLRLVALFEANRRAWHRPAPRSSQTPNESAHDVRGSHDAS